MHIRDLISIAVLTAVQMAAQSAGIFVPPTLRGSRNVASSNPIAPADDPAALYQSLHEAAVAALKEANKVAALSRSGDRAINLLLIAAKRDPSFGKPVYNLGVLCAKADRWQDAINFYGAAQQVDPTPQMVKLAADELERVQMLSSLEATAEGRRRRQFDQDFMGALKNSKDPVLALDSVTRLNKNDAGRWEALALAGILQAELGKYGDSAKALEAAARLAPETHRKGLASAADLAKREAQYEDLVQNGDLNWEKQQYEQAAKLYAEAWNLNEGQAAVGMQSATGFLMSDQVSLGVQILTRIRQTGSTEYSQKATLMLRELAAISEEAKRAASLNRSDTAAIAKSDATGGIRGFVGELSSPEMNLVVKATPELLQDNTDFIPIPDPELTRPEIAYLSSESIFERYKNNRNSTLQVALPAGSEPAQTTPLSPAQQPSLPSDAPDHGTTSGRPAKLNRRSDVVPDGVNSSGKAAISPAEHRVE
jgi:tetratricopeptide (TPR) repeat protein